MRGFLSASLALSVVCCVGGPFVAAADSHGGARDEGVRVSGFGTLQGNGTWLDEEDGNTLAGEADRFGAMGAGASVDVAMDSLHTQIDFRGEGAFGHDGGRNDDYVGSYGGAIHLGVRGEQGHLGGFSSLQRVEVDQDFALPSRDHNVFTVGAEGQLYLERITLGLQAGYLGSAGAEDAPNQGGFLRTGLDAFPADNTRLGGELSYMEAEIDNDDERFGALGWGFGVEQRLGDGPVSAGLQYNGHYYEQGGEEDAYLDHVFSVAIRVYFGGDTLLWNNRHGAGLASPLVERWSSAGAGAIE